MNTPKWMFHRHRPGDAWDGMGIQMVIRPELDSFVREVVQNVIDQRIGTANPARVEFVIRDHQGDDADQLLSLMGWNRGLEEHMKGVSEGKNHLSEKLKVALSSASEKSIRTLTISDSNTNGLTGDELSNSNFANLCRHVMVTEHGGKAKGGAFGIGKSVLWAFSRGSVVFFSSRFIDDKRPGPDYRMIGRCYFPSHRAEGIGEGERFEGNAWFGMPAETNGHEWIKSLRSEGAKEFLAGSPLERSNATTGTSIMIPFFGSPVEEEDIEGEKLKNEISHSIVKWFWPAMSEGLLDASVGYVDSAGNSFVDAVELEPWIQPYLRSLYFVEETDLAEEPGTCARGEIDLRIPGRKARENQHNGFDAQVGLNVTKLTESEIDLIPEGMSNRVALVRGVCMVVQYYSGLPDSLPDFVGILKAGALHGNSDADMATEHFLRDSEPPAHDKWELTAKLRENYRPGGGSSLNDLFANIRTRARSLLGSTSRTTGEAPKKLAELLKGRKPGPEKASRGPARVMISDPSITRNGVGVIGKCKVSGPIERPWSVNLRMAVKTEDNSKVSLDHSESQHTVLSGPAISVIRENLVEDKLSSAMISPGLQISVPEGTREFQFEFSASGEFLGPAVLARSRIEISSKNQPKVVSASNSEETDDE